MLVACPLVASPSARPAQRLTSATLDAFIEHMTPPLPEDTGDPRRDARAWLNSIADFLADPSKGPLTAGLIGAVQHDPDLAAAWHEWLYLPVRAVTVARLRAARRRDCGPKPTRRC